jgi:hypothetical protein
MKGPEDARCSFGSGVILAVGLKEICLISFFHNIICHAITVLSGNISTHMAYKQTGPWLPLANQLMCHLMIKVSSSWANTSINIEVMFDMMDTHPKYY